MPSSSRSEFSRVAWIVAVLVVGGAVAGLLTLRSTPDNSGAVAPSEEEAKAAQRLDEAGLAAVAMRLGQQYGDAGPTSIRAVVTTRDKVNSYYGDATDSSADDEAVIQLLVSGDFTDEIPTMPDRPAPGEEPKVATETIHGSMLEVTVTKDDLEVTDWGMVKDGGPHIDLGELGGEVVTIPL